MSVGVQERVAPVFPAGYDRMKYLFPLYHSATFQRKHGRDYRRRITWDDPLLFALIYLDRQLTDEVTGEISLSEMHMAICTHARRWVRPGRDRSAWVSHRDAGKSSWWFLVLPLWAAAHGHRDFFLALSCTEAQAKKQMRTLKLALERADVESWLLHDFPNLRPGRPWTVNDLATVGGCRFIAAGMGETILGLRDRERRPKLIVGDDLEPGPEDWTRASKAKTLGRLINDTLPAASREAAIALVGTPVGPGSLMHDVVRGARGRPGLLTDKGEWVRSAGFTPYWFPAILDEGTPRERSAWPTRFSLEALFAERAADEATFALQRQCDPDDPAAQRGWSDTTFRRVRHFEADWRIGSVDAAGPPGRSGGSDHMAFVGVAAAGIGTARARVCVEEAAAGSWDDTELLERIWRWAERYPRSKKTLIAEGNGVGAWLARLLTPLPPGVELEEPFHVGQPKDFRIRSLLAEYRRGAVLHWGEQLELEAQMIAWRPGASGPNVDDLIDATRAAVDRALYGDASQSPSRRSA